MPRNFPVPVYTTTSVAGSADQRTLSATSPGTTDSTATNCTNNLGPTGWIMVPEKAGSQQGSTTAPTPYPVSALWMLAINPALAPSGAAVTIAAGAWTIPVHYSRAGGLLTGDVLGTFTAVLIRTDGSSNLGEIGRATGAQVTVGTAEASQNISVSGAAVSLQPGEFLALGIFCVHNGALLGGDTIRVHTNSTTALRITAAPTYTTQFARALNDTPAMADTLGRQVSYSRQLTDAPLVSDALARRVDRLRALSDAAAVNDTLTRRVDSNRALADTMAASSDTLGRRVALNRQLADSPAVSDTLQRKVGYSRALQDNLSEGGGGTTIIVRRPIYADDD